MALQLILPIWLPILLFLCFLYLYKKIVAWKGPTEQLPPGPPKLPIIGNLHQLGELPHRSLWKLSKQYGPVMYLRFGGVPTVVVSSSEAAKQILKVHDLDCCSRPALTGTGRLSYNYRDIGFTPYGDYWREMRKLCVLELFSARRVQSFQSDIEEEVYSMIASISPGVSIDLGEKVISLTANIIGRVAFGQSFHSSSKFGNSRLNEVMHECSAMLGSFCASDFFPYVGWIVDRLTGLSARLERSFHDLDDIYQKAIDEHLDEGRGSKQGQEDIVDVLLKIEKEQAVSGGGQFTRDHVKGILMNVFAAAIDSSALTIVWAMSELVKNPRSLKKAQDEVRSLTGNKGKVNEADLDNLDYLKLVVTETLRLHPPAPMLIPRETMAPFKIDGYRIPVKTRVYVNVWAIARDPSSWNEPEKFFPERFEATSFDYKGQQHFELLPFGGGRRGCPGMHLGLAVVNLTLANLLYHFEWRLPNGMKEEDLSMEEMFGLTVKRKGPLDLVPTKYHPPS